MRIPEIIDRLRELALEHQLSELDELADELRRRPPERRAPQTSVSMTPELRADIRRHAERYPGATQAEIAAHFNVGQGRVSETLRGFRQ